MKKFFKSSAFKAFICVIAALLLGAVIAAFTHNNSTPLSSATSVVLHPVQRFSSYLSYKFSNFNDNFKSSATLAKENEKLKKEIDEYKEQIIDYNEMQNKLETYEDFLGVKEDNPDFVFKNAKIIAHDSTNPYCSFTLNKGSSSGIKINDPIIYGKNLVGVVTSVSPTTCTVITIANPEMNISVFESYTNEIGYACGIGNNSNQVYLKIPGLKNDSSISPNGIICTTGSGGIYPKNLIVGTVVKINEASDGISKYATVRSAINLAELSEVFIITEFDGQGEVSLAD
ncbi:MAG: rod shape-determining protein MreC [Ruminococcus sp.]|nr:rod shape-determining protein MreC [Candidatus Copronaster equi]